MIVFAIVGALAGLFVALLIMAVVLRAACYCVGVKEPDYLPAMGITFLVGLCVGVFNFLVESAVGESAGAGGRKQTEPLVRAALALIPLGINTVVAGYFYALFLHKCTFAKGILIYLLQLVILIAIVMVVMVPYAILIAVGK